MKSLISGDAKWNSLSNRAGRSSHAKSSINSTLLIAEAVANAVRHGQAKRVRARLCYENDQMQVEIKDDGRGFPHRAKVQLPEPIQSEELPRSLHQRIANLQGQFQVWTCDSGTRLQFEFPA